jgi:hypothetical protein
MTPADYFNNKDTVDLADLDFGLQPETGVAARLSAFIISFINIDDFVCYDPEAQANPRWESTAGCGNSSRGFKYNNQAMALSALAHTLSGFSIGRWGSCYLAECDYNLLVEVKTYIDEEYNPASRMQHNGEWLHGVKTLNQVIEKWEDAYAKDHPEYLMKILKRNKT